MHNKFIFQVYIFRFCYNYSSSAPVLIKRERFILVCRYLLSNIKNKIKYVIGVKRLFLLQKLFGCLPRYEE